MSEEKSHSTIDTAVVSLRKFINDAYNEGYTQGLKDAAANQKPELTSATDDYTRGLENAWAVAHEIAWDLTVSNLRKAGFDVDQAGSDDEFYVSASVIHNYTIHDCIQLLSAYHRTKKKLQIGDEVTTDSGYSAIVVNVPDDETDLVTIMFADGSTIQENRCKLRSTGDHFDGICEILFHLKKKGSKKV